ncbi:MAG: MFS transporter [bacterium]|nr:MFS transporter [bacterium]
MTAEEATREGRRSWAGFQRRIFATPQFFRLWSAQVVTSTGDWLGFLAISVVAARLGSGTPEAAIGLVLAARLVPGIFFSQVAGVLADRFDRRRLMVVCDLARAGILLIVPLVNSVWQLVLVSLALEAFTLLWIPAKEASVPNLLPAKHLTAANSLSMLATYATFPVASLIYARVAGALEGASRDGWLGLRDPDKQGPVFYLDALTFVASAALVFSLPLRHHRHPDRSARAALRWEGVVREYRQGWRYVVVNPTVRSVNIGLATALIGGGMLIPLALVYAIEVLRVGEGGFADIVTALSAGVGVGVVVLSLLQRRVHKHRVFARSVTGAGLCLLVAASLGSLPWVMLVAGAVGMCAGGMYVLGFTLLHEHTADEVRGRVFAGLYSIVRLCVVLALVVGPLLAAAFDRISELLFDRSIHIGSVVVELPGVRLTLWLAGLTVIVAGLLARRTQRAVAAAGADGAAGSLAGAEPDSSLED